jgi:nucleoside-diphosphate-sugar epimerase
MVSPVLVTGGTGFIGRHLVPRLIESGCDVTLLLREQYGMGKPLPEPLQALRRRFQVVYADLRNFRLTRRAVERAAPRTVIHLAAAGATDPFLEVRAALRHNLDGSLHLLRASFEAMGGVERVVVCRTPGELTAMNVYAASKAAAWDFCRMYARTARWPIVGAMIFQTYGPGQRSHALVPAALAAALRGDDFPMTSGEQERDWIYVADVVEGLLATLAAPELAPGTTVELGTGRSTSVADVVRSIYEVVNQGGAPLVGRLPSRPGEMPHQAADAARTAELIGWRAGKTLQEGLAAFVAEHQLQM